MTDYKARIVCDSVNGQGHRLTTAVLTYPRCIHSEFMTHRMFARNSASSRAIPVRQQIKTVEQHPFVPEHWGLEQRGMQASKVHDSPERCRAEWLEARDHAVERASLLHSMGLHKQIVNRIIEPWSWITVVATAIDKGWENFFGLRCHADAEPHMQKIAYMARDAYDASIPTRLLHGQWHLPFVGDNGGHPTLDRELFLSSDRELLAKVSTARCARVSYLTHDGRRSVEKDLKLAKRLEGGSGGLGHWSPFEHIAQVVHLTDSLPDSYGGCFGPHGYYQYRKMFGDREVTIQAPRD